MPTPRQFAVLPSLLPFRSLRALLAFLVLAALAAALLASARSEARLQVLTDTPLPVSFLWLDDQSRLLDQSAPLSLVPRVPEALVYGPSLRRARYLEIIISNPPDAQYQFHSRDILLRSLRVTQPGFAPLDFDTPAELATLYPQDGVFITSNLPDDGLRLHIVSNTARLRIKLKPPGGFVRTAYALALPLLLLRWLLLLALLPLLVLALRALLPPLRDRLPAPAAALAAFLIALPLAMSTSSVFNAHSDEIWHFSAAAYYLHRDLPPAPGDPIINPSRSTYGASYLERFELAHWLLGKAMRLAQLLPGPDPGPDLYLAARLLHCALFAGLLLFLLTRPDRLPALVLLLTPQIWYIFSYINSDALPLAATLLASWQIASPHSALARLLCREKFLCAWPALLTAVLLAVLYFSKKNYWIALLLLATLLLWKLVPLLLPPASPLRQRLRPLLLAAPALLLLGQLLLFNPLPAQSTAQPVQPAQPALRDTRAGIETLFLRSKGETLSDILFVRDWPGRTYQSFSGLYGWTALPSPPLHYWLMALLHTAFLVLLLSAILRSSPTPADILLALLCLLAALASALASLHHCWTIDFQPQGRYLLPALAAPAVLLAHFGPRLPPRFRQALLVTGLLLLLVGAVSFLFTALRLINFSLPETYP